MGQFCSFALVPQLDFSFNSSSVLQHAPRQITGYSGLATSCAPTATLCAGRISSFTTFVAPLYFSICVPRAWVTKTEIQSAEISGESAKKAETS